MFDFFSPISESKARALSPVTLAFVGDAVYSLIIREKEVLKHDLNPNELQKITSSYVSAHGQNELLKSLVLKFNEEEAEIFRRGRNAKKAAKSKNSTVAEYNRSTGFEAVLGYLYLCGKYERIAELLKDENEV